MWGTIPGNILLTHTRGPQSYWHSTGAGYSASTMPPHRHTQIPAPGTAMPLIPISACHQQTDVGRVDVCRPTDPLIRKQHQRDPQEAPGNALCDVLVVKIGPLKGKGSLFVWCLL